jgi:hypothetical protein
MRERFRARFSVEAKAEALAVCEDSVTAWQEKASAWRTTRM